MVKSAVLVSLGGLVSTSSADMSYITAQPCDASRASQLWDFKNGNIVQRSTSSCIDIEGYKTADLSPVWEYACHNEDTDPSHQNQLWTYDEATKEIYVPDKGTAKRMRLDCSNYCADGPGSTVWIFHKTGAVNQQWSYDASTGLIKSMQNKWKDHDLCLDSDAPPQPRPCDADPGKSQPWCDTSLSLEDRVKNLVSRIPANRVVGLFSNGAAGVPELNIPKYQWWSEALHGVGRSPGVSFSGKTPFATSFPQVILTSSSFNTSLFHEIGSVISTEARAFNNVGHAGNTFWTPNINIYRDPRWGRGQETPGEDPVHNGAYAANFVPGMQEGEDPSHIKASACLKHYAAYNLENWGGVDRHHFDAKVTEQDLADTYYPPFEDGVKKGKASGMMCSYNAVNGVPSCANKPMLNDQARAKWGFDGYITSDCEAVNDIYAKHKFETDANKVPKLVLEAGMDSDCGGFLAGHMQASIDAGVTTPADFNAALTNMFRVRMRLGHFDPAKSQPYMQYGVDRINTPAHQQLALEAARQGIVLLKNKGGLPFSKAEVKSVALIGPNAAATGTMQGNYQGKAPYLISPKEALEKMATVNYVSGCDMAGSDTSGFAAAEDAAAKADATVLVMGLNGGQEGEGHDRTSIALPGVQGQLIDAVVAKAKGPVVLVVMSGGAVDISKAKGDDGVSSILWVGYPGQSGGQAIAEILFGDVNPSGQLTQTWHPASYVDECSFFDMNMRPNTTTGCKGHTYRFYTGETIYKFGDGISYTTFSYESQLKSSRTTIQAGLVDKYLQSGDSETTVATINVDLTNTGPMKGDEVTLLFAHPPNAGEDGAPLKSLRDYRRTTLAGGGKQTLEFNIKAGDLALTDSKGLRGSRAGAWTIEIGSTKHRLVVTESNELTV